MFKVPIALPIVTGPQGWLATAAQIAGIAGLLLAIVAWWRGSLRRARRAEEGRSRGVPDHLPGRMRKAMIREDERRVRNVQDMLDHHGLTSTQQHQRARTVVRVAYKSFGEAYREERVSASEWRSQLDNEILRQAIREISRLGSRQRPRSGR
jgi:hypothetical protein